MDSMVLIAKLNTHPGTKNFSGIMSNPTDTRAQHSCRFQYSPHNTLIPPFSLCTSLVSRVRRRVSSPERLNTSGTKDIENLGFPAVKAVPNSLTAP